MRTHASKRLLPIRRLLVVAALALLLLGSLATIAGGHAKPRKAPPLTCHRIAVRFAHRHRWMPSSRSSDAEKSCVNCARLGCGRRNANAVSRNGRCAS